MNSGARFRKMPQIICVRGAAFQVKGLSGETVGAGTATGPPSVPEQESG